MAGFRSPNLAAVALFSALAVTCFSQETPLPFLTGFESSEAITAGAINGQGNWNADNGVVVTTVLANWGDQSIVLPASSTPLRASLKFAPAPDFPVVFTDFYTLPTASASPSAFIEIEGAKIAFVQTGAGQAELYLFNGDGVGGGSWGGTGRNLPVDANNQSVSWLRLTVREDFSLGRWSLYLGAELIASGKGLVDGSKMGLSFLTLISQKTGPISFDDLLVGFDNPMFVDANNNGIDDALEGSGNSDGEGNLPNLPKGPKPTSEQPDGGGILPPTPRPLPVPIISAATLLRLKVNLPLRR